MKNKIRTTFNLLRQAYYAFAFFAVTLLSSIQTFSQAPNWQWATALGVDINDYGNSIVTDASGNVFITGGFSGVVDFDPGPGVSIIFAYAGEDIFISKFDSAGNFVWAKAMGYTGHDKGNSIAVDALGNVYTTGLFSGTVDFDPSPATVFNLTSDAFSNDIFVCKLDSSGNFVWAKAMGGASNDYAFSMALDASANIYTTGVFSGTADFDPGAGTFNMTSTGFNDIFISRLDSAGNFGWAKGMGSNTYAWGQSVSADASGNILVTGVFANTVDFDPGAGIFNLTAVAGYDVFICRFDNTGNFSWARAIGGASQDDGLSIATDATGNVYTCGLFLSTVDFDPGAGTFNITSAGNGDAFVCKLNSSGNFIWAKSLGGTDHDRARSLTADASGNVYIVGEFNGTADFDPGVGTFNFTSNGFDDIFLCKLDSSGNFGWAKQAGGDMGDIATSVALSTAGNLHITGYFFSHLITVTSTLLNADTSATTSDILIAKTGNVIVTGNNELENYGNAFLLFPNPALSQLSIVSKYLAISNIEVYNTVGENVISITPYISPHEEELWVDVSSLSAGIYFLRLTTEEKTYSQKFIKR